MRAISVMIVASALSACAGVGKLSAPPPGEPVHYALIWKRYALICLGAGADDKSFKQKIARRFGQRHEAVLAGLSNKYGEEALDGNWIDVDGCKTDGSEKRLTRAYLAELEAWETELGLR